MNAKLLSSIATGVALLLAGLTAAQAAPPVQYCATRNTSLSATPNPATLDFGPGIDTTLNSLTTASPDPPTPADPCSVEIDNGKVNYQVATDGFGNPVPTASVVTWVGISSFVNPVGGAASLPVDLDGLLFVPGSVGGFRAHYVTGGGQNGVPTHFSSPALDVSAVGEQCSGFTITADFASGEGSPPPNYSGSWVFRIKIRNCTGVDLFGIKTQGGTNGWAPFTGAVPSTGSVVIKNNNKNQILTWTSNLLNGEEATLLVTVAGSIPKSAVCDSIRFLSGPWSSVYDAGLGAQKSDYTGRVSITVTCP